MHISPANSSPPSVLAEMLTAALGAQCMLWETSPAAAELEERMMEWLRSMTGIPPEFEGVIQDSASSATLAALITAREKVTRFRSNRKDSLMQAVSAFMSQPRLTHRWRRGQGLPDLDAITW